MSALLFASGASLLADDRTWTDVKGRKIEAEFLRGGGTRPGYGTIIGTGLKVRALEAGSVSGSVRLAGSEIERLEALLCVYDLEPKKIKVSKRIAKVPKYARGVTK